jgi:hypothetical protein
MKFAFSFEGQKLAFDIFAQQQQQFTVVLDQQQAAADPYPLCYLCYEYYRPWLCSYLRLLFILLRMCGLVAAACGEIRSLRGDYCVLSWLLLLNPLDMTLLLHY